MVIYSLSFEAFFSAAAYFAGLFFLTSNVDKNSDLLIFFPLPSDVCCDHVEGGQYIGPEFQLGQVYDGSLGMEEGETIVLYRPVYVCVRKSSSFNKHQEQSIANNNSRGNKSNSISKKNSISQLQSINELNTSLHCDPGPSRRC